MTKQEYTVPGDHLGDGISLYVHIPFCKTKCPYCDFNTYQGIEELIQPYIDALALEIRLWGGTLGCPRVNTIFFGGGTPSYVPRQHLETLLDSIAGAFEVVPGVETTVEANPGDLNGQSLERTLEMGVNRLSIGVQSLDDSLLSLLGPPPHLRRRHRGISAGMAVRVPQHQPGPDVRVAAPDHGALGEHAR